MHLALQDARVGRVFTCKGQREKRIMHGQKLHAKTFITHVTEAIEKCIGQVGNFVLTWELGMLEL